MVLISLVSAFFKDSFVEEGKTSPLDVVMAIDGTFYVLSNLWADEPRLGHGGQGDETAQWKQDVQGFQEIFLGHSFDDNQAEDAAALQHAELHEDYQQAQQPYDGHLPLLDDGNGDELDSFLNGWEELMQENT